MYGKEEKKEKKGKRIRRIFVRRPRCPAGLIA
jgi:hypothetical protein